MLRVLKTPARLRDMAEALETEARHLRSEAATIEQRQDFERDIARRQRLIRDAADTVARGGNRDKEIDYLARALECQRGSATLLLTEATAKRRTTAKIARNRQIMRLASLGWSNEEIGGQFALHPKHITRIVQGTLKSARGLRNVT